MAFSRLSRQCTWCSSHIYIEDRKKDVIDKVVDGRRHLSVRCPTCGEKMEIVCKMVSREEIKREEIDE